MSLTENRVGRIVVPINKSQTVRLDRSYAELMVGSSDIADVLPLTDQSLYILGKAIGTTNISIVDRDKRLLGVIDVEVTRDAPLIQSRIRESTGNQDIVVTDNNGQLVLSGIVADGPSVERAIDVANQFAPGAVVNALNVSTSQQVLLKVRFIEATRTAGREIGIRWDARGKGTNIRVGNESYPGGGAAFPPGSTPLLEAVGALASGVSPFGVVLANLVNGGFRIDALLKALETRGLLRILAEPNLVALSGETAEFLAGGEYPVPVPGENGQATIEYKRFGVSLAFTPTVLQDGHINLKLEPEVSQLDFSNSVTIQGTTVPALTTRRASTTIELRDAQSFAIAGLFQTESRRQISQLPWISRVPIIGMLFRSTSFNNRETDLVIIVTPHLVQPGAPGDLISTPLDNTLPANDIDLFVNGDMEIPKDYRRYVETGGRLKGPYGHMLELEFGADGPVTK